MKLQKKTNSSVDTLSLDGLDDVFKESVEAEGNRKKKLEEKVEKTKLAEKSEKNKKDKKTKKKEEKNKKTEVKEIVGQILTGPKRKIEAARNKALAKTRNYVLPVPKEGAKSPQETTSLRDRISETIECSRRVMKPIAEVNLAAIETQYKVQIQTLQDALHSLHARFERFAVREREYMEMELAYHDMERAYEQRELESEKREFARMERDRENQERIMSLESQVMFLESQVEALQATLTSNKVLRDRMREMEEELVYHRRSALEKFVDWLFMIDRRPRRT